MTMNHRSDARSRARLVATRLTAILHAYLAGKADDEAIVKALRRLALDLEKGGLLQPRDVRPAVPQQVVDDLFSFWSSKMDKPRAKLTPGRRRAIQARLADGYTPDQLRAAISACASSDFHMGENDAGRKYNDITLILRSGEKVEWFIELGGDAAAADDDMARLRMMAAEAMREGDTDAYNRANARIIAAGKSTAAG